MRIALVVLILAAVVTTFAAVAVYFLKEGGVIQLPVPLPVAEEKRDDEIFYPLSIPALAEKEFDGRDLELGEVLSENEAYTRYFITYMGGDLTISGIMNVPKGNGPFPVLILNHGYIDPDIYTNGRGLKREQDYLAREGYVIVHPDYRNHAESDDVEPSELDFRFGYTEDVINAVYAVRESDLPFLDKERIGMLGHSMGGGITINVIVAKPGLVDAVVLFAPVSANYEDNFHRWTERRSEYRDRIVSSFGTPTTNPSFWKNISPINFLDRVEAPVLIHHGTADESVPVEWSRNLHDALEAEGKEVTYYTYPGEPHEFATAWIEVMSRTTEFFDSILK